MRTTIAIALPLLIFGPALAADAFDVGSFATTIEPKLQKARYMEQDCQPVSVPGWDGYETQQCTYRVTDHAGGASKAATVVMLNPSALKLSEWIINACTRVLPGHDLQACARRVFDRVLVQSGGQYPVAGIVDEDLLPEDGIYEAYGFRDGITTILEGVKHRQTTPFSQQELEVALTARPLQTASSEAPARPIGVSKSQFLKVNPTASVDHLNWLVTVREEYKKAWKGNRNTLIEAWLASNAS